MPTKKTTFNPVVIAILTSLLFTSALRVHSGPPPFPDEMKYPNVVSPTAQFGTLGIEGGQFNTPSDVAINSKGDIYVCDTSNHRIQIFDKTGKFLRGFGTRGSGPGDLCAPEGIALSPEGLIYVSDTGNDRVQVFDSEGKSKFVWMYSDGSKDRFCQPKGIWADQNRVLIADSGRNRIVALSNRGQHQFSFGRYGSNDGQFNEPLDVTADSHGNIYVADSDNNRIQKFDPRGVFSLSWGAWGSHAGLFATPVGVEAKGEKVYVVEQINHRIQVFDQNGKFQYQWGRHPATAHEGNGRIHYPHAIAVSDEARIAVEVEPVENRCQVFALANTIPPTQVNDSAWWEKGNRFHYGARVSKGGRGEIAISEPDTHAILLFDINAETPKYLGKVGSFGGKAGEFVRPTGVFLQENGTLFASDSGNRRVQQFLARASTPAEGDTKLLFTKAISMQKATEVFAANESRRNPISGGMRQASVTSREVTRLQSDDIEDFDPSAINKGPDGNLYIIDPTHSKIGVFDTNMVALRFWGEYGKEPGKMRKPLDLSFSKDGKTVFVVDAYNCRIQAFGLDGTFKFTWGSPGPSGNEFHDPFGITSGVDGFVYVTDTGTHAIKKFKEDGTFVSEWGGWGTEPGRFYKPKGIAQVADGRLFILDFANHRGQIMTSEGKYLSMFGIGDLYTRPVNPDKTPDK